MASDVDRHDPVFGSPTVGTLSMTSRIRTALFATASLACRAAPAMADGLAGAPAPFDKGAVKLALVGYISAGDFFEAYQSGAVAQAKKLGVDLRIFPGKQDPAEERSQIEQAVNLGVKGIVIDHGLPESLKDVAQKALDAGVKVVAFDVNLDNPNIPQVEQSDHLLARLALEQALKDNGEAFSAAYVYVAGFAPLDRRDEVWSEFKTKHPGVQEVARFGVVNGTTAASVADQAKAALRTHPEITVVFAPYDEFARGVKRRKGQPLGGDGCDQSCSRRRRVDPRRSARGRRPGSRPADRHRTDAAHPEGPA